MGKCVSSEYDQQLLPPDDGPGHLPQKSFSKKILRPPSEMFFIKYRILMISSKKKKPSSFSKKNPRPLNLFEKSSPPVDGAGLKFLKKDPTPFFSKKSSPPVDGPGLLPRSFSSEIFFIKYRILMISSKKRSP